MSVNDGQAVSAAITNAAYVSKTATSGNNVSGKINLQNADSESIANITNVQKVINQESTSFRTVQTVTASGTITIDERIKNHVVLVVGDGGNVTASTTPFNAENGGSFLDGTEVTVIGTNQSQQVTIQNQSAASNVTIQNGDVDLGLRYAITYLRVTIGGTSYWLEKSRNH
jgi:hypothetical protein